MFYHSLAHFAPSLVFSSSCFFSGSGLYLTHLIFWQVPSLLSGFRQRIQRFVILKQSIVLFLSAYSAIRGAAENKRAPAIGGHVFRDSLTLLIQFRIVRVILLVQRGKLTLNSVHSVRVPTHGGVKILRA